MAGVLLLCILQIWAAMLLFEKPSPNLKNKALLDSIGLLFNLQLKSEIDENTFETYNYYLKEKVKGIAEITYYQCLSCSTKYLLADMFLLGDDDRHPEPDRVYIEKILQVEFDHEEFMEELKKG